MNNTQKNMPSTDDMERAERLRGVFDALNEVNRRFPIIVEGKRDAVALKHIGLAGKIITLHNGKNLYDFCENITEKFAKVIILTDWDAKGDNLLKTLSKNLEGRWEEFSPFREILKILCQKDIKDIEGIPKLIMRLEGHRHTAE